MGAYYPTIQANYSASRAWVSGIVSPMLISGDEPYTLRMAQVTVGFAPDVFGGNRRQVESLKARADFQHFQLEALILHLHRMW